MPMTAEPTRLPRIARRIAAALPALLAMAALAGCGGSTKPEQFAPACPQLKVIKDAADLTRVRGQGSDITDLILQARIASIPGSCAEAKGGVKTRIQVIMEATRGPASSSRSVELPYLITVTLGENIIEQQYFASPADFPANADRMAVAGEEIDLLVPATAERPASNYTIYVSFRLTAAELAFNRKARR